MAAKKEDLTHLQHRADGTDQLCERKRNPCNGCVYCGGKTEYVKSCNYYLITGNRRPCDIGEGCTVRLDRCNVRRTPMRIKNLQ